MAYSGTTGQTVVTVQQFIDQGARQAGKLAEELTVEQVQSAKQALFFILSNLINQGINYWAIEKQVYGLQPNQYEYLLPVGGNDVLNALYRWMTRPTAGYSTSAGGTVGNVADNDVSTYCAQSSANGNIIATYAVNNPQYIGSIGLMIRGRRRIGDLELLLPSIFGRHKLDHVVHRHGCNRDRWPVDLARH